MICTTMLRVKILFSESDQADGSVLQCNFEYVVHEGTTLQGTVYTLVIKHKHLPPTPNCCTSHWDLLIMRGVAGITIC